MVKLLSADVDSGEVIASDTKTFVVRMKRDLGCVMVYVHPIVDGEERQIGLIGGQNALRFNPGDLR